MVAIGVPQRDFPRPLAERARPARCGHPRGTPGHGRSGSRGGRCPRARGCGSPAGPAARARSGLPRSPLGSFLPPQGIFLGLLSLPSAAWHCRAGSLAHAQPGGRKGFNSSSFSWSLGFFAF